MQILLFCYHYDPHTGKYGLLISRVIQLPAVLTVLMAEFLFILFRREHYALPEKSLKTGAAADRAPEKDTNGTVMMGLIQSGLQSAWRSMGDDSHPAARRPPSIADRRGSALLFPHGHHAVLHRADFLDHFLFHDEVPPALAGRECRRKRMRRLVLELAWTIIPSLICVVSFRGPSAVYVRNARPPAASTEIFVIGKQWMWHLQHPEGPREINELHVPVGEPVKLTMTSQDVIHDFYIPAFRVKKDVLPGRYTSIWFQATETGTYHLFCAQYCGTNHSEMIGWVYVMTPGGLRGMARGRRKNESMAAAGRAPVHAIRLRHVPH